MFWHLVITLVVLIILVLIWWAIKKSKRNTTTPDIIFPSKKYMEQIGGKCPDYWTYLGDDKNGRSFCQNTYKIQIKETSYPCTHTGTDIKAFPTYKHWSPTGTALTERCDWITKCGPVANMDASWVGMDKVCSQQASQ